MIEISNASTLESSLNEAINQIKKTRDIVHKDLGAIYAARQDPEMIYVLAQAYTDCLETLDILKARTVKTYNKMAPKSAD